MQQVADLRFKVCGFSSGIEPFIFKSGRAHQWPGVRDRYQAKSVVPKRQAPTSHRDNRCAPGGREAARVGSESGPVRDFLSQGHNYSSRGPGTRAVIRKENALSLWVKASGKAVGQGGSM